MEPDVVEIAPPVASSSRSRKQKQIVVPEVIDVEQYEITNGDGGDSVLNKNKGKATRLGSFTDSHGGGSSSGGVNHTESHLSPGSHSLLDPDFWIYEDDYESFDQYPPEAMNVDEYSMFQDLLDSKDIPTGVEVSIPWFPNSNGSSSSNANNGKNQDLASNYKEIPMSSPQQQWSAALETSASSLLQTSIYSSPSPFPFNSPASSHPWNPFLNVNGGTMNPFPAPQALDMVMPVHPSGLSFPLPPAPSNSYAFACSRPRVDDVILAKDCSRDQKKVEDFLGKFLFFKRFDTVEDFSDHHYASKGSSSKQYNKTWAKRIQEEWKILENDLPDTIFVRAYESRMDLLRAVIIGAEGTPYHDGLFFFDIYFPDSYPNLPPQVHYHAGGLRINPNLYKCGKVCLSLLGTWSGSQKEKWIPNVSTMLQVLVSVQALILNQNPYFNEPGYERTAGTPMGESNSKAYSENTFILSLKTMIYNMRRPPKNFEDFSNGHFFSRAHDILKACKAYKEGAPVGSVVKGGVQDLEENGSSGSMKFRGDVECFMKLLATEFAVLGVKDIGKVVTGSGGGDEEAGEDQKTRAKPKNKRDRESH